MHSLRCRPNATRLMMPAILLIAAAPALLPAAEVPLASPWSVSLSSGYLDLEGDDPLDDGGLVSLRAGYAFAELWTLEGGLDLAPRLDESWRRDWRTRARISRLEERAGDGANDSWNTRALLEVQRHLRRGQRLDPFVAVGGGASWHEEDFGDNPEGLVQTGLGVLYHLTDAWALRADARLAYTANDSEFNGLYLVGLRWSPLTGSRASDLPVAHRAPPPTAPAPAPTPPPAAVAAPVPAPGATVAPAPDSDWDGLSDADEVQKYGTDPRKRDTDGGGVYDGHEVLTDATDPKVRVDDLILFELRIAFDPGEAKVKSEYYSEIGVIGKLLKDHPEATALIEGHVDGDPKAAGKAGQRLSAARAAAVRDALAKDWGIPKGRMTDEGYGATRPKGPPGTENDRVEVFIRGVTK